MSSFLSRAPASSPIRGETKRDRSASRSSREHTISLGQGSAGIGTDGLVWMCSGGSSVQLSDFYADFKPYHQGTNVSLAPIDRFRLHKTVVEEPRGRAGRRESESASGPVKPNGELTREGQSERVALIQSVLS